MSKPVFSNLFTFSGRRNRKSYFLLTHFLLLTIGAFAYLLFLADKDASQVFVMPLAIALQVWLLICIALGWIAMAQRCRDFGWTGWAALLVFVPIVGWLFALALWFIPGTPKENRYGPDPLAIE